jgi:HlyD family secretion protein
MTRNRLIILVVIAALVTAAVLTRGFGLFGPSRSGELVLNGNVDIRQVDLGFRLSGRIATIPFEEGARVPVGAALARLESRPIDDRLAAADAQVAGAAAEVAKRRNGNRAQDIASAAAQLADRQAQLAKAKEDFDRRRGLVATGAISQAVFDATRAAYEAAQAQANAARQLLSLQREGARPEDVAAAQAQRADAVARRAAVLTDRNDAILRAPNAGVILTRAREPGAIVQPGETVITLTIDRPMRVRAYIAETDLSRISPGMAVEVTADGTPRAYHGTIGYIAPTAEFTPKTVQTEDLRSDLVYRLRIVVTDPDDGLRQGQPVTVRITGARPAAR